MHLPDGFLDAKTALLTTAVSTAGVGIALQQVRTLLKPRQMPLLGVAAAVVFAAQMLNFPVMGGTSGHLIGGVLTGVLLGPSAAVLVITCVLIVQCLMFADGGLMALGANVFNMAIASVCSGYLVYRLSMRVIRMERHRATVFAAAFAAWVGTVVASICCAGELALSHTVAWPLAFPAMANVHMLIGIGEGLATGLIVMTVLRARPELLAEEASAGRVTNLGFLCYGLVLSVGLLLFVSPFACPWPDGLQAVAHNLGFEPRAIPPLVEAPLPEYKLHWIGSATLATSIAGLIGTLLAFAAAYALARVLTPSLGNPKKDASSRS